MKKFNNKEINLTAGTYYVGDLCYVMDNDENTGKWKEVCDLICINNTVIEGDFELKDNIKFVIFSTAYGDGCYEGKMVDSGSIGIIDIKHLTKEQVAEYRWDIHTFDTDFKVSNNEGNMKFGNLNIDTTNDDFSDEDEYEHLTDKEIEMLKNKDFTGKEAAIKAENQNDLDADKAKIAAHSFDDVVQDIADKNDVKIDYIWFYTTDTNYAFVVDVDNLNGSWHFSSTKENFMKDTTLEAIDVDFSNFIDNQ